MWTGSATLNSVTGGGCIGAALQAAIGSTTSFAVAVTQTGSSLTATVTEAGSSCSYSGSVGTSTVVLNLTTCEIGSLLGAQCPNGALRDVMVVSGALTGSVSGNRITGTATDMFNIFVAGTSTGAGALTSSYSFQVTRQ